jgi:hypothetical protein
MNGCLFKVTYKPRILIAKLVSPKQKGDAFSVCKPLMLGV